MINARCTIWLQRKLYPHGASFPIGSEFWPNLNGYHGREDQNQPLELHFERGESHNFGSDRGSVRSRQAIALGPPGL
jgi:hypothetical protein